LARSELSLDVDDVGVAEHREHRAAERATVFTDGRISESLIALRQRYLERGVIPVRTRAD
jgi:hypothetical protein